jgi:DNA modification methylase
LEELRNQAPDDYIDLRLRELREEVIEFEQENMGAGKTLPDDIPSPPAKTITKPGDIWRLGPHRLMCGSSTNPDDVSCLLEKEEAKLLATDPPYCVDYTGTARPNSKGSKKSHGGKDWSGVYHEVDIKDAAAFYESYLRISLKHCVKNVGVYMWHASRRYVEIAGIFEKLGILIHQPIIWVKPCSIMTYSVYSWKHEPCIFGWPKGEKPHYRPAMKGIGTAWHIDLLRTGDPTSPEYYSDIWELDWEGKKRPSAKNHPTVKPTEVFAIPMRIHTQPGDICYEPFSGSGSQIIAGERVNRRVFAMEIEPHFV